MSGGLAVPLAVRLQTERTDRHVTANVRDLEFRSVARGGFASAQLKLDYPLTADPPEIQPYGRMYIYDRRNGRTVWEGRQEDPGRGVSSAGQVWDLTAVGPSAHLHDRTEPVIYVDRSLTVYQPYNVPWLSNGQVNIVADLYSGAAFAMQWPNGSVLATNPHISRIHPQVRAAGQRLARIDYAWTAGRTHASLRVQAHAWTAAGAFTLIRDEAFNVAGGGLSPRVIGTDWPTDRDAFEIRIAWTAGLATVGDDVTWAAIGDLVVQGTRYDQFGTHLLTGASYTANTVLASQIVADLLGRWLTQFDGANAAIATTTYPIDQLAYPDGVTPAKILDDLLELEIGYTYAAWESDQYAASVALPALKNRFEFKQWPTTPRYEYTVRDGFSSPGSATELYNRVGVRYRRADGTIVVAAATSTVDDLTAVGLTRTAAIDLGDDIGSAANAARVGAQFLAEHATPPNAGRLTVAGPVVDNESGRRVMPWELLPGHLIRVRGVLPHINALNPDGRDGVTVFKINAVTFRASTGTAELELDSYPLSVARALADLASNQPTSGRSRRR